MQLLMCKSKKRLHTLRMLPRTMHLSRGAIFLPVIEFSFSLSRSIQLSSGWATYGSRRWLSFDVPLNKSFPSCQDVSGLQGSGPWSLLPPGKREHILLLMYSAVSSISCAMLGLREQSTQSCCYNLGVEQLEGNYSSVGVSDLCKGWGQPPSWSVQQNGESFLCFPHGSSSENAFGKRSSAWLVHCLQEVHCLVNKPHHVQWTRN